MTPLPPAETRRRRLLLLPVAAVALFAAGGGAQMPAVGGQVSTPGSSVEKPGDIGVRAHSNVEIFTPRRTGGAAAWPGGAGSGDAVPPSPPAGKAGMSSPR